MWVDILYMVCGRVRVHGSACVQVSVGQYMDASVSVCVCEGVCAGVSESTAQQRKSFEAPWNALCM